MTANRTLPFRTRTRDAVENSTFRPSRRQEATAADLSATAFATHCCCRIRSGWNKRAVKAHRARHIRMKECHPVRCRKFLLSRYIAEFVGGSTPVSVRRPRRRSTVKKLLRSTILQIYREVLEYASVSFLLAFRKLSSCFPFNHPKCHDYPRAVNNPILNFSFTTTADTHGNGRDALRQGLGGARTSMIGANDDFD